MGTVESIDEGDVLAKVEALLRTHPPATTDRLAFLDAQFDAGLAYVHFPVGLGGLNGPPHLQQVVDEALTAAGAPANGRQFNAIAAGQGAATVLFYGSEDQQRRYIRPLFNGELMGCQLYSEPGSGSDLASLSTRAVRDGDTWIVNGQKVWTSGAHRAGWALLLARTDPDVPKHAGLTQFCLDMTQPGVEVRPLRQMSGGVEFNEVFLTDVRIPDSERLGEVGEGWKGSQTTLVFERYNMPRVAGRGEGAIAPVVAAWKARADTTSPAAVALKDELMRHWVQAEVLRLLQARAAVARASGSTGPEGSLGKLAVSVANRALAEWAVKLVGADGMLIDGYEAPPELDPREGGGRRRRTPTGPYALQQACVGSPGTSIAGGTDQIQRNIIGERVLGLPREPAADRGVAWSQTPRNA